MKLWALLKSFATSIRNGLTETKSLLSYIANFLFEIFKRVKSMSIFALGMIRYNLHITRKYIVAFLFLFTLLFFIDTAVRFFNFFDIDVYYSAAIESVYRLSSFVHKLYWVPYRFARFYALTTFTGLMNSTAGVFNAFIKNFLYFKNYASTNPSHEEVVYLLSVWIFLNYCVILFFLALLPCKNQKDTKQVVPKGFYIKKLFIVFKFLTFLFIKLSIATTWVYINVKKIFVFFYKYAFTYTFSLITVLLKKFYSCTLLFWKPVFKKWSYYGIYRTYKSKWLKK